MNTQGTKATVDTAPGLEWATFIWDVDHKFRLVEPKSTPGSFEAGMQAMTELEKQMGQAIALCAK